MGFLIATIRVNSSFSVQGFVFLLRSTRALNSSKAGKLKAHNKRIPHSEIVGFCGGRDPFYEFSLSMQTMDSQTLPDGAGDFSEKLQKLEAKIAKLERMIEGRDQESRSRAEAA